jgi:hypothetical protein
MAAGPKLDISADYDLWDNQQDVTLFVPDGRSIPVSALMGEISMVPVELGEGNIGYRQFVDWRLPRALLGGLVPIIRSYILDPRGQKWFVGSCNIAAWGTSYQLSTELEAGEVTPEIVLPGTGTGSSDLIWSGSGLESPIIWE